MQWTVDFGKPFDQITFVGEREEVEKLLSEGWSPAWEPNMKIKDLSLPNYSDYLILVRNSHQEVTLC